MKGGGGGILTFGPSPKISQSYEKGFYSICDLFVCFVLQIQSYFGERRQEGSYS